MIALLLLFTGRDDDDDDDAVIDPELSSLSLNTWNALELLLLPGTVHRINFSRSSISSL
jgi:hypothetical protein